MFCSRHCRPAKMALMSSLQPLPGVRTLLFDTFGTTVDWRQASAERPRLSSANTGCLTSIPPPSPMPGAGAIARPWKRSAAGADPSHAWMCSIARTSKSCLTEFGIDPAQIPAAALDALNSAWHRLDPWPDSIAGLHRLRRRFLIAPLSNGNIILLANMAKRAGIPWDAILGAEVVQAYKPTPQSYLRTADVLSMQPEEIGLVAAHNGDLAAARACGLKTVFVPARRNTVRGKPRTCAPNRIGMWWQTIRGSRRSARTLIHAPPSDRCPRFLRHLAKGEALQVSDHNGLDLV